MHDRRPAGERERFSSRILPPYLRKARSIEQLIPWLYLKGVSTGEFSDALEVPVGEGCPGRSASTVTRLTEHGRGEHEQWSARDLSGKAAECLSKDREVLLTFYDFPAEHWVHLRTTNPIESTFAAVRLRHRRTKGNGSRRACLAMVFKLCQSAQARWRRLNGHELIEDVIAGVTFTDGEKQTAA